ncbi:DegT/DnrJ/EryC1/StrS family aminotransferase [Planotetraspora sp. A-T 1434]|uniref:DegT/DnrJ/EryC1/StrS family aminotransferase n=1 Tax=Planotetraspora sp. A-T 1434 TaxID=2979219 RepID=UPI0021C1E1EF|nr:DegT/DnrJ/EryC1/StrS family aminotransferase [Planotetraspora sp. A-T 1434]MCT9931975.1 DegT/DnrJ/EryC1/StrS family aminotransferase [Planotetraspora sp. A-T 1434]
MIPFVDLRAAHEEVAEEIDAGFARVLGSTAFMQGPDVAAFEEEFAAFSGVAHCVGVGNGTDAIELALRALGVGAGSEVILPANTFVATAEAVLRVGARPVLVDADPAHLLMDPDGLAAAVTSRTAAVIPVHLYGRLAPMDRITEIAGGVPVVEDAAQSQGAARGGTVSGAFGALAATSFYPGKNLGAYGDAGAVTTGSAELARKVRLLSNHGSEVKYRHETLGFNSRLDTLQAVVLRAKLRRLGEWNDRRREAAARYGELLADLAGAGVTPPASPEESLRPDHVWHLYVVRVPDRDRVLAGLHELGVQAQIHYPVPVHLQPAFADLGYREGDFPVAERAAGEILSLPIFPHITPGQQEQVVEALRKAL